MSARHQGQFRGRGRRGADVVATLPHRMGRDAVWQALRSLAAPATAAEITRAAGAPHGTVCRFLRALRAAGIAERDGAAWRLLRDTGPTAPALRPDGTPTQAGAKQDRMWRSMQMLRRFTARDIAVGASIEGAPINERVAMDYLRLLTAAGYLAASADVHNRWTGARVFRLIRRTGPRAPVIQRAQQDGRTVRRVWDPNLRQLMQAGGR